MTTNSWKSTLSTSYSAISRRMTRLAATIGLVAATSGIISAQIRITQPVKSIVVYNLTDLSGEWVSSGWSFAYAINNSGEAVGEFVDLGGANHAFRTQPNAQIEYFGGADDLGILPNPDPNSPGGFSHGYAINSVGAVVGDSVPTGGANHAFLSSGPGAALVDLNTVKGSNTLVISNATQMHARGINDSGWVVGNFSTNSVDDPMAGHSFVSFGQGITQPIDASWLGNPTFSATYDVNNQGNLAGSLTPAGTFESIAFFLNVTAQRLTKIGTFPGGSSSVAYALNDAGQVVGTAQIQNAVSYGSHAFLFQDANGNGVVDPGELKDLDTMNTSNSGAMGINNGGVAVGYYGAPDHLTYAASKAVIFSSGVMQDLNGLVQNPNGWTLRAATGINDRGQIVGFMQNGGTLHAFRLDPVVVR